MNKIDYKKELDGYQANYHEICLINVPKIQYLMIDGHGDPNTSQEFKDAILALYPVAYKLKFASKQNLGKDYTVMPLEGLWWADDMNVFTTARNKSKWNFTLMIMTPDWIMQDMLKQAVIEMVKKAKIPASLHKIRLEALEENLCAQTLHIGSFDDEAKIIDEMHNVFIPNNGYKMTGKHHEIYLSDFRKVSSDKLRTILRQPVEKI